MEDEFDGTPVMVHLVVSELVAGGPMRACDLIRHAGGKLRPGTAPGALRSARDRGLVVAHGVEWEATLRGVAMLERLEELGRVPGEPAGAVTIAGRTTNSGPVARSLAARFARHCGARTATGCIPWTGHRRGKRPGLRWQRRPRNTTLRADRVAWELRHGPIPAGHDIEHTCANTMCVNHEHMRLVRRL